MRFPEDYIGKVLHGDCLEIMNNMPDGCVDLVLTDPPYGIGIARKSTIGGVGKSGKHYRVNDYIVSDWDNNSMSEGMFAEITRISKEQIIFGYNYITDIIGPSNSLIIWDKKLRNDWSDNFSDGEIAWSSIKRPLRIFRHLFMGCTGNNEITRGEKVHPTQKPIKLMEWILFNYSNIYDLILDPFCGSGTTLVAAKMLGRRFIGIEIEEKYCKIAEERLRNTTPPLPFTTEKMEQGFLP